MIIKPSYEGKEGKHALMVALRCDPKTKIRRCNMKKYEIMYIVSAKLDEAAYKEEVAKLQGILETNGAKVNKTDEWGVKDFAYPIKKQTKGYYVVLKVSTEGSLDEFNRLAKLDNNVIRHLVTVDQD